jgi:large exoprotein involved in heme utilization and adhesion
VDRDRVDLTFSTLIGDEFSMLVVACKTATAQAGNLGNITLQTGNLQLRHNTQITTNANGTATGGNINIDAGAVAEERK